MLREKSCRDGTGGREEVMKELRLVIVDDEELAIQNLEEQIEAINGPYRIVGTARNGVQAWELLQKVKPDVAFIDIKMPVLTGLELAKKIKDEHMKTEVVLVSAYQEFEYAKQGIELGICQYILKHEVGSASLSKLLEQLWNKWNTEQITTTFSVQSILGAIVNGAYVQSQIKEHFIKAKEELKTFSILMVQRNAPIHFANSGSFFEQPSPVNVEEILIRKKEELHLIAVLPYHGAHVLLFHKPFESYLLRMGFLQQYADEIIAFLKPSVQGSLSVVAVMREITLDELSPIVQAAYRELDKLSVLKRDSFQILNLKEDNPQKQAGSLTTVKEILIHCLEERKLEQVSSCLNRIQESLTAGQYSRSGLERVLKELYETLQGFRKRQNLPPVEYTVLKKPDAYCISEAVDWFREAMEFTISETEGLIHVTSKKLKEALAYIQDHFTESITQQQVAEALGFSSVYLGLLFRKEMQLSFLEYVTKCRIDKAKYYLVHTNQKIYEISDHVGYMTSQYFSKIFKQQTGMTPAEYRERGGKSDEY